MLPPRTADEFLLDESYRQIADNFGAVDPEVGPRPDNLLHEAPHPVTALVRSNWTPTDTAPLSVPALADRQLQKLSPMLTLLALVRKLKPSNAATVSYHGILVPCDWTVTRKPPSMIYALN